jgi:hypothetical protein
MDLFTEVQDGVAILISKGVFTQVPLYRRGNMLYCKHGAGYLKLLAGGITTRPDVKWLDFDVGADYRFETTPLAIQLAELTGNSSITRRSSPTLDRAQLRGMIGG